MRADIRALIECNRSGVPVALPSICSSHPEVIRAAALLARFLDQPLLVEATSNQVNQFGGYTGMDPAGFISFVWNICDGAGFERDRIIFGGDHLGPQAWRDQEADAAMTHAADLVKSFVEAGFTKIHLDCSEGCRNEPSQVSDQISARRTAQLAAICEKHAPDPTALSYIVGTEVPPPGGARAGEGDHGIIPTSAESAAATLTEQRLCFERHASSDAWSRVVGLVVQPGLEFSGNSVHHFASQSPDCLSPILNNYPGVAFEAHSTDYQRPDVFPELAKRHFAILKVGPALTFAYRQAIYALDAMAGWYHSPGRTEPLPAKMEALMLANPANWIKHYSGTDEEIHRLRHFGYADRIRYFWNQPEAQTAVQGVIGRLRRNKPDLPLTEQYFAPAVISNAQVLLGNNRNWPEALILAQIQEALMPYFLTMLPDGRRADHYLPQ